MIGPAPTVGSLDYLQRSGAPPAALEADFARTSAPSGRRRVDRIAGIGTFEKFPSPKGEGETSMRLLTEDVLAGLYGEAIPLAFLVQGSPQGIALQVGVWSAEQREQVSAGVLDARS